MQLAGLLVAAVLAVSAEDRPFLGVTSTAVTERVEVDGRIFERGLRLEAVEAGSAAEAAGLRDGDILVELEGVDFTVSAADLPGALRAAVLARRPGDRLQVTWVRDGVDREARLDGTTISDPAAWTDAAGYITTRPAGTYLDLTVRRVRGLHTARVTLRALSDRHGMANRDMPSSAAILPTAPADLPEEAFIDDLVHRRGLTADYAAMRGTLASLVMQGDPYRLGRVAAAMREPFAAPAIMRSLADGPFEPVPLLMAASNFLDQPAGEAITRGAPLRTGLTADEHAGQLELLLIEAAAIRDQAFASLTADERQFLERTLPELSTAFAEGVMVLTDANRERAERVRRCTEVGSRVDVSLLAAAAMRLAAAFEPAYLAGLQHDLAGQGEGIIVSRPTPLGAIVLTGKGGSLHAEDAAVLIDLGGEDIYTQPTRRPVSLMADLAGDDLYQSTVDGGQAAGIMSVALLLDAAGDDTYIGRRWSQGAAAAGVGVLWDRAGNDTYRGEHYCQAAAFIGIGLLIDDAGDDRYESPGFGQALGMPGGLGLLVDRSGRDSYYCSGRSPTNYGTAGVFDAFGQGCGIGFRRLASGGAALLLEMAGDDTYFGANFAQGGGYYYGWGGLIDRGGDDRYLGCRYAQAWAAHQAIGTFEDLSGDDDYQAWQHVGQSCAWDESISLLIDRSGDDVYASNGDFSLAASHNNGLAVLIDGDGRDRYECRNAVPRADPDGDRDSFSLLLDLGGDEDQYISGAANNAIRQANRHGFLADLKAEVPPAGTELEPLLAK